MKEKSRFVGGLPILKQVFHAYSSSLMDKSREIAGFFERKMRLVCAAWLVFALGGIALKVSFPATPVHNLADAMPMLIVYSSVISAPILGYIVARHAFTDQAARLQPSFRFAIVGKWRQLTRQEAESRPAYGPIGFMASLLVGLILNVVIRTLEFFTAVPAMSMHAPAWGRGMFWFMGLDLVVTSFFYMAAFAMALRSIPLFPRMLGFAWLLDVTMQLIVARSVAAIGGVPAIVVDPLLDLLNGNITKVLISIAIWMPYLLLSERVNITYRCRTYAG